MKFQNYAETVPRLLDILNLKKELKKYDKIVLKPTLKYSEESDGANKASTKKEFVEQVLKFCMENKNPVGEIFIAEGVDGADTEELFNKYGYKDLAEKYSIGLIDLNEAETEEVIFDDFQRFERIKYPKILMDSFIIVLSQLAEDSETEIYGALASMLGAFPASQYQGFFSSRKNKIRKWPIKYSIHDIVRAKMPEFAIVDASEKGLLLAGQPIEMDKQGAKLLGREWKSISYIRMLDDLYTQMEQNKARILENKKMNEQIRSQVAEDDR